MFLAPTTPSPRLTNFPLLSGPGRDTLHGEREEVQGQTGRPGDRGRVVSVDDSRSGRDVESRLTFPLTIVSPRLRVLSRERKVSESKHYPKKKKDPLE